MPDLSSSEKGATTEKAEVRGVDQEGSTARTEAPASNQILERRIAYAEEAIPRWRANLAEWRVTRIYRGQRVDDTWLRREADALAGLEADYRMWLLARGRSRCG